MVDFAYHHPGFRSMGSCVLKILADTVFQFFCLTYINHPIVFIPHDIYAGSQRQAGGLILQFVNCHCRHHKKTVSMPLALRRWTESSINIPLKQSFESVDSRLSIMSGSGENNLSTGNNPQGHHTQKAFCIHFPVLGFQPNAAVIFVGFLNKVCCLAIVQARFTADSYDFFTEHSFTLLCASLRS